MLGYDAQDTWELTGCKQANKQINNFLLKAISSINNIPKNVTSEVIFIYKNASLDKRYIFG